MTATSGRWSLVGVVVASSLVLFLGVTMRTRIQDADGIVLSLYGFPLPWLRASLATSITDCVDPFALVIDIASVLALVSLAAYPFRVRATRWLAARSWPLVVASIVAMPALVWLALVWMIAQPDRGLGEGWRVIGRELLWVWAS